MLTSNIHILAAGGEEQLNESINNVGRTLQVVGGSIITVVIIAIAIMMMLGAFSDGGALKKHLGRVAVIAVACLLLGGGGVLGPMFTDIGRSTTGGTTQQEPSGSVN